MMSKLPPSKQDPIEGRSAAEYAKEMKNNMMAKHLEVYQNVLRNRGHES